MCVNNVTLGKFLDSSTRGQITCNAIAESIDTDINFSHYRIMRYCAPMKPYGLTTIDKNKIILVIL